MQNEDIQQKPPRSGLAIAALVLGIVSLATSFLPIINNGSFFIALVGAILAIIGIVGIRKGKKSGMGMGVAGLITSLVAIAIVFGSQAMYGAAIDSASKELDKVTGDATEQVLATDVDVTLGQLSINKGEYGIIESELPVTVKNLLNESKSFSIQIEAVDAAGNRLATDYVYANDLSAGQSQQFKAFQFVSSDDYDAMKGASFNIVSVSEF